MSVYEEALSAVDGKNAADCVPQTGRRLFTFDPRAVGFREKMAVVVRGPFDAMPLCLAFPIGQYFHTEEIYYSTTERLADQEGHLLLFDFPHANLLQLNNFFSDLIRDRSARYLTWYNGLEDQNLVNVSNVRLSSINPLRANPYSTENERYYHLPKRRLEDGHWVTLSLVDQVRELRARWLES
jgi:hypothetical protein